MAIWCLWPLASSLRNGLSPILGIEQVLYHLFAWGCPYLLGRLYINDGWSLHELALGLVVAGLCYAPLCWVEFYTGPSIYHFFYDYQPFQFVGHLRYIGYRPIVFMEDGNQLGMWMSTSSLTALWLWLRGEMAQIWKIPGWAAVFILLGTTMMCQSVGSILLLLLGIMLLMVVTRSGGRRFFGLVIATLTLIIVVHGTNVVSLDYIKDTWLGGKTRGMLYHVDRASLSWRLRIDQHHLDSASQRPILGWGQSDWWKNNHPIRPWGLWLLVWGMYGLVGWTILGVAVLGPTYLILMQATQDPGARDPLWNVVSLLAVVLFINMGDAFLNSAFIGVFIVISGALTNLVINRRLLPLKTIIRTELTKHFGR